MRSRYLFLQRIRPFRNRQGDYRVYWTLNITDGRAYPFAGPIKTSLALHALFTGIQAYIARRLLPYRLHDGLKIRQGPGSHKSCDVNDARGKPPESQRITFEDAEGRSKAGAVKMILALAVSVADTKGDLKPACDGINKTGA